MKTSVLAAAFALGAVSVLAQDPLVGAPRAYKLGFENEWVRVVRVHYAPHELVVAHDHTPTATAYVYLNDSGPVVFNHIDKDYGAVTRNPTKAGSFRVYHGIQEVHEVSNTSDLPSDFLRVEFKTQPKGDARLKGTFFREPHAEGEVFQKVHFENEQIRITRLIWPARTSLDIGTTATDPTLIVVMSEAGASVRTHVKGKGTIVNLALGRSRWIETSRQEEWENIGKAPAEVLRFDFKTPPLSREDLENKSKKHDHVKG